jgi:hypothetical protein
VAGGTPRGDSQGGRKVAGAWTRAEVEAALGQPLMVENPRLGASQAARLLGVTIGQFRLLVRAGLVVRRGDRGHRRYLLSDLALARARLEVRQAAASPGPDLDPVHAGRMPATVAAALLGVPVRELRRDARLGLVPAVQDRRGDWWVQPEHLEFIRRIRRVNGGG